MTPDVCIDIGNTRLKVLLKSGQFRAMSWPSEPLSEATFRELELPAQAKFALCGVHPERVQQFASWITRQGYELFWLQSHEQIPMPVALAQPERVGLDRLLGALAALRRKLPDHAAIVVDAGTAVTVNAVSPTGVFLGGAIAPGWRTLRLALHQQTAKLPFVQEAPEHLGELPGKSTEEAIFLGTRELFLGGVARLLQQTLAKLPSPGQIFFTGGDGQLLAKNLREYLGEYVPTLTLEGLRWACEAAT